MYSLISAVPFNRSFADIRYERIKKNYVLCFPVTMRWSLAFSLIMCIVIFYPMFLDNFLWKDIIYFSCFWCSIGVKECCKGLLIMRFLFHISVFQCSPVFVKKKGNILSLFLVCGESVRFLIKGLAIMVFLDVTCLPIYTFRYRQFVIPFEFLGFGVRYKCDVVSFSSYCYFFFLY